MNFNCITKLNTSRSADTSSSRGSKRAGSGPGSHHNPSQPKDAMELDPIKNPGSKVPIGLPPGPISKFSQKFGLCEYDLQSFPNIRTFGLYIARQPFMFSIGAGGSNIQRESTPPEQGPSLRSTHSPSTPPPNISLLEQKRRRLDEQPNKTVVIPRYHDQTRVNLQQPMYDDSRPSSTWSQPESSVPFKKKVVVISDTGE